MGLPGRLLLLTAAMLIAVAGIAQAPAEVRTDVKVLELDRSSLRNLGLLPSAGPLSLVVNVTDTIVRTLAAGQGSRTLQSFQLTTAGDNSAQFRVASRVQALDAGVDFKLQSKVSAKREISMQVVSQVRVRREEEGGDASPLFIGQTVMQEIITTDGSNVLIGGFVTDGDWGRLTKIGTLQKSPLLNYVFSTEDVDEPEVVLILTPHLDRPPSPEAAVATIRPAPAPAETSRYSVQVAAFKEEGRARGLLNELNLRYTDAFLLMTSPGQAFFRVRVGRIAEFRTAAQLQKQLAADGYEPIIVRLK